MTIDGARIVAHFDSFPPPPTLTLPLGLRRGAQPMLTAQLLRPAGTGAHLSTSGLEFDEKVLRLGPDCALRLAASVDFPREYPPPRLDDEGGLRLNIKKLGVKKCFRWYHSTAKKTELRSADGGKGRQNDAAATSKG